MRPRFGQEIDRVLQTAQSAAELTERIFGPGGLCSQLAPTQRERKRFVSSPLFEQVQARLHELHEAEEKEFSRGVLQEERREQLAGARSPLRKPRKSG